MDRTVEEAGAAAEEEGGQEEGEGGEGGGEQGEGGEGGKAEETRASQKSEEKKEEMKPSLKPPSPLAHKYVPSLSSHFSVCSRRTFRSAYSGARSC